METMVFLGLKTLIHTHTQKNTWLNICTSLFIMSVTDLLWFRRFQVSDKADTEVHSDQSAYVNENRHKIPDRHVGKCQKPKQFQFQMRLRGEAGRSKLYFSGQRQFTVVHSIIFKGNNYINNHNLINQLIGQ